MQLKEFVSKKIKQVKGVVKRTKKLNIEYINRKRYMWHWENSPIEEKTILLEALDGAIPTGNIAALLKELYYNPVYQEYKIFLSGRPETYETRREYLIQQNMTRVTALASNSKEYYKTLATAKYLGSEVTFMHVFIKRPEQIYLNTWHGTPLKTLGRSINNDYATLGNVQKNMFDANYLLCPNEFTRDVFIRDYMLENFAKTKLLLGGYPRNTAFFDEGRRAEIRKECGFGDKQVIAFLPTWRGVTGKVQGSSQNQELLQYFIELDGKLTNNQIFYVKLHQMNLVGIDLSKFVHIKPFPLEYDSYEFLNATDLLVTDYSSVFFDYANCRQKIVLFTYDKEQYMAERGFYFSLDELPFPQVATIDELVEEMKRSKNYDDTAFMQKFCAYDHPDITNALCRKWIFGEDSPLLVEQDVPYNGKKNVVMFIGGFEKNGITTSAINLLNTLDLDKNNYAVIYRMNDVKKRQDCVKLLPEKVSYMGFYHARSLKLSEVVPFMLWKMVRIFPFRWVSGIMDRMCDREKIRIFSYSRIDKVIQFTGYSEEIIVTCNRMPCSSTIYVHNDKEQEIKLRGTTDKALLSRAFRQYDSVAVVTEDLLPSTKKVARYYKGRNLKEANLVVCKNVIDYKRIKNMGEKELMFDKTTVMNACQERILEVLESDVKKFVNVGRFAPEKGHFRLISAFEKIHAEEPDTCLFIIGGYGSLYEETMQRVRESVCADSIFIIQYMSNPYPLMKKCDYFVLSSLYEGFGLVLVEADILGVPCFSTDIVGPRLFMQKYGGKMVADSEEGIVQGMRDCLAGNVPKKLDVDYEEYNQEAIAQFESLIP